MVTTVDSLQVFLHRTMDLDLKILSVDLQPPGLQPSDIRYQQLPPPWLRANLLCRVPQQARLLQGPGMERLLHIIQLHLGCLQCPEWVHSLLEVLRPTWPPHSLVKA